MQPDLHTSAENAADLSLHVIDPDVLAELALIPDLSEREAFALAALRIGVLAIRQAEGTVDERAVRDAGKAVVAEVERVMAEHRQLMVGRIEGEMKSYFDLANGKVPQFIEGLTRPNGSLDRILRQHLLGDQSTLASTLVRHIGAESPLLRMLSPDQKTGLLSQVQELVRRSLEEQRATLLGEFDLNREESALSRLVKQMKDGQGTLETSFRETIGRLATEWSLDNENSSVARFKKDVAGLIEKLTASQAGFQQEVIRELSALRERRAVEVQTPRKGATFEEALGFLLQAEAQKAREVFTRVGTSVGELKNCRKGDFVLELGAESVAPGERIVVEAKDAANKDQKKALEELAQARPNRKAQVGVFVFSRAVAPPGMPRFQRNGNDLVIVWDAEDPATDLWVQGALEVARALVVRRARETAAASSGLGDLDTAIAQLEKDALLLDGIAKHATTIGAAAEDIRGEVDKLKKRISAQVSKMRDGLSALKGAEGGV